MSRFDVMTMNLCGDPLPAFSGVVLSVRTNHGEELMSPAADRLLSRVFGADPEDLPRKTKPSARPVGRPRTQSIEVPQ